MPALVLGPLLRHCDETSATLWVEVDSACRVTVEAGGRRWSTGTFAVHGHHYALVALDGLAPGTSLPYALSLDDDPVWPEPGSPHPATMLTFEPRCLGM